MGADTIQANGQDATEALARWRGVRAKFWDYSPSHSKLTLRVESSARVGNLHIVCGGCYYVHGPLNWDQSSFEVVPCDDPDQGAVKVLRDVRAGFEVRCLLVGCVENVEPVYFAGQPADRSPALSGPATDRHLDL